MGFDDGAGVGDATPFVPAPVPRNLAATAAALARASAMFLLISILVLVVPFVCDAGNPLLERALLVSPFWRLSFAGRFKVDGLSVISSV